MTPIKSVLSITFIKKIFFYGLAALLLLLLFLVVCNYWVTSSSKAKVFDTHKDIPTNDIALVLGTIKTTSRGYDNPYFYNRIAAAERLFKMGKVKHFIVSGDNSRKGYDEPTDMRDALMARGIPESAITLDYAGFRTLDSVVRCKEIFQQEKITIISQAFHNYRALFIAQKYDIEAVAFNAKDHFENVNTKVGFREYLARCKAVLDLYILNKQPKFLGDKIDIKI